MSLKAMLSSSVEEGEDLPPLASPDSEDFDLNDAEQFENRRGSLSQGSSK